MEEEVKILDTENVREYPIYVTSDEYEKIVGNTK